MVFGRNLNSSAPEIMAFIAAGITRFKQLRADRIYYPGEKYSSCLNGLTICHLMINRLQKLNFLINRRSLKTILWEVNNPEKIRYD